MKHLTRFKLFENDSNTNRIEIPQDRWKEWLTKIDASEKYTQCELYMDEGNNIVIINKPSLSLNGDNLMIRYTKSDQDRDLENKLEKMKRDDIIDTAHYFSPVNPEGIITHVGNLKSVSK